MEEIEDYGTGIALTQQEISELVEQYEKYKLAHWKFNQEFTPNTSNNTPILL